MSLDPGFCDCLVEKTRKIGSVILYAAKFPAYSVLFSLIKEKFIHEMEHFDWWKHLSGYSLRIRDELLF